MPAREIAERRSASKGVNGSRRRVDQDPVENVGPLGQGGSAVAGEACSVRPASGSVPCQLGGSGGAAVSGVDDGGGTPHRDVDEQFG
jgi:hypothetical protein